MIFPQRNTTAAAGADDKPSEVDGADVTPSNDKGNSETESVQSPSNLVFGYLNLFSDGVVSLHLYYDLHISFSSEFRLQ